MESGRTVCTICGEASQPFGHVPAGGRAHSSPGSASRPGFLSALFDFSFSSLITGKLIKLLYAIATALAALFALGVIVTGFHQNTGLGVLALLLSPVAFLLAVTYSRVGLEILIVVFKIEEHLAGGAVAGVATGAARGTPVRG